MKVKVRRGQRGPHTHSNVVHSDQDDGTYHDVDAENSKQMFLRSNFNADDQSAPGSAANIPSQPVPAYPKSQKSERTLRSNDAPKVDYHLENARIISTLGLKRTFDRKRTIQPVRMERAAAAGSPGDRRLSGATFSTHSYQAPGVMIVNVNNYQINMDPSSADAARNLNTVLQGGNFNSNSCLNTSEQYFHKKHQLYGMRSGSTARSRPQMQQVATLPSHSGISPMRGAQADAYSNRSNGKIS